ncbi:hypothetical protein [Nodosilinea nodulosa]|uniref:hypothetical protein n=1 Tax=Nodosilinea nodulosa TaxID=416001 RepID=UPI00037AB915|nr:hypothetical protein [Nodosilinea nodulosa]
MPSKWLYLEFLVPVRDYTATLDKREFVFDWILPLVFSCLLYFFVLSPGTYTDEMSNLVGSLLSVLGVLFGFSIASITLLITSNGGAIDLIKNRLTKNRKISGRPVSIYQLTIITFTFLLFLEIYGILLNFLYLLILSSHYAFWESSWKVFYAVDFLLLFQVIALNVRNTTNIYFIFLEPFRPK